MRNNVLLITFLVMSNYAIGQIAITFQLDLNNLTEKGLLSPHSDYSVYVRGTFNNWEGTDYKLTLSSEKNIYKGTFEIPKEVGDKIEYKYVIEKTPEHFFWEWKPQPDNPNYGSRFFIINSKEMVLPKVYFQYNEYFEYPVVFSKEKLQEDFLQFRNILEKTHPALYDYTDKKTLDSLFDSNYAKITGDMEFSKFLILMTEVISKVGCGHSSLWVPGTYWNIAPQNLFPLKLHISGNKIIVTESYQDTLGVPIGSEVLTINKIPIQTIIDKLSSLTSADGFNQSYKLTKVAQDFSNKYALIYGLPNAFEVEYIVPKSSQKELVSLFPVTKKVIDENKSSHSKLTFEEVEKSHTGILTINTFGYYNKVNEFKKFIDSVFQVTHKKNIKKLILDLRGNSGGDPFCASYLWAYLQPKSLPYFADHYGKYDTLANPVPQPINHYKGKLFTLIDGNGFSTTGHFCGLLKYHNVGKFIGTEMGSTYTCTGNATYPPLNNTGIMVGTARVRRYTAAVQNMDPMRGIIPDYTVELTQQDIIDGKDPIMEYALMLTNSLIE